MFRKIGLIVGCLACGMILLSACSSNALSEAKQTVAQADSVWAEGGMYNDSLSLAQAYETLSSFNYPLLSTLNSQLSTDFVHACYHYGKLLRAKDDPVAAMQVFINATHAGSDDKHILGRIYSNMGSICHLAGEYSLAYDMYEKSTNCFLLQQDSLLYYYGLNNMAYESAEKGDKETTQMLLSRIEQNGCDTFLMTKTLETKARMYYVIKQYDSVLLAVDSLHTLGYVRPTGYELKARALWHMERYDSALVIAKYVMSMPEASNQNKYNMLYVLLNCDSTLQAEEIKALSEQRADIEAKLLRPMHKRNAVAVNSLQNDIVRKPSLTWLYAILITIGFVSGIASIYISSKRKRHRLLSQQIQALEEKAQETIEQKRAQVESHCAIFLKSNDFKKDLCWNDYAKMCDIVNQYFYLLAKKLQIDYSLSEKEVRLCILTLFDFGYDKMADYLFYAPNGIGKFKMRVSRKVGTTAKNLRQFLIGKAIGD